MHGRCEIQFLTEWGAHFTKITRILLNSSLPQKRRDWHNKITRGNQVIFYNKDLNCQMYSIQCPGYNVLKSLDPRSPKTPDTEIWSSGNQRTMSFALWPLWVLTNRKTNISFNVMLLKALSCPSHILIFNSLFASESFVWIQQTKNQSKFRTSMIITLKHY